MSRQKSKPAALTTLAALGVALAPFAACNAISGVDDYTFAAGGGATSTTVASTGGTGGTPGVTTSTTGGGGTGGGTGGTGGGGPVACPGGTPEECTNAIGGEVPNGVARCEAGVCVAECEGKGQTKHFGDCDGDFRNGCEVDLRADPRNCGSCARACSTANVASLVCENGACTSACLPGFVNCKTDAASDDGCEAPSSNENCGGCGNNCGDQLGGTCGNGACACSGTSDCGPLSQCSSGRCRCTLTSTTCAPGEQCTAVGACSCNGGDACSSGQVCCDSPGGCFNLKTSAASCGACGRSCPPGFACAEGKCGCTAGENEGCNAGSAGVCLESGLCQCGLAICAEGQRCLGDGSCG